MSIYRTGSWGGDRTGQIIIATTPLTGRIGSCYVKKNAIRLPSGAILEGVLDTPIGDYLAVGMLAVAVAHSGDYFNNYVPVNATSDEGAQTLTPFLDLEFGAYEFGETVGRLGAQDIRKLAAGLAIEYNGLIAYSIPKLTEAH